VESSSSPPWNREEFEQRLRALGARYHIHHPYQVKMNAGELNREQIQGWVANRFYYQIKIPQKDAAVMANCPDREVRRHWVQRILDHDGRAGEDGGIEAWIRLGEACGLERDAIVSLGHVLPGVRFAVDAYVNFVRRASWQEAVCSSLTELFAPTIHRERIAQWPSHYPWMDPAGLEYFQKRLGVFTTAEQQMRALEILQFKLDVLWSMLDAMTLAYVLGMPPYFTVEETQ
jgi:pyrroloquinoline-quinone synthase